MNYLLASLGSAGDLHPYLALARALRRHGHDVELMSNAPYRALVEAEGVTFSPLCSQRDHDRTANHPDLWHPVRGFGVLWRHLAVPAIDPVLERVQSFTSGSEHPPGSVRVLASPLAVGARLAWAARRFPLASVYTAPANLRPLGNPMFVGPWQVPGWTPPAARRALWWALDRWKLEPLARDLVARRCADLGAPPPTGSLFGRWLHSPEGGVALYPATFGPAPPAQPGTVIQQGEFPRFRASADVGLPAALQAFLADGDAPVVVFAGSAPGPQGRELLRLASEACRALGQRCVVLAPENALPSTGRWARGPQSDCLLLPHAALAELLPHALAFVHHGGAGSCAEGLAAGVPQIIQPFAYDQFDNAARLRLRHVADVLPPGAAARLALLNLLQGAASTARPARVGAPDADAANLAAVARWESSRH